jgi:L-threonylcarbamoyladenylate synthase
MGNDLEQAAAILRRGGLVAIPTETVYGLAANALNTQAVAGIFKAKNRPSFDPLIVHAASTEEAFQWAADIPALARTLAHAFWPGPLTLVLPKQPSIPDLTTSGQPSVALRVPRNRLSLKLLSNLDFPLAAPSANPFGYVSPTRPSHVSDQLGSLVDYILDDGPCSIGLESTIVDLTGEPTVLRLGGLSLEQLEAVTGFALPTQLSSSKPKAPGQLTSHYAPRVPVRVGTLDELLAKPLSDTTALVTFQRQPTQTKYQWQLSENGSDVEAATTLFHLLRHLDQPAVFSAIFMEWAPDRGLGRAINDRLQRAQSRL